MVQGYKDTVSWTKWEWTKFVCTLFSDFTAMYSKPPATSVGLVTQRM